MKVSVRLAFSRDLPEIEALYRLAASEQEGLKLGWTVQTSWGARAPEVLKEIVLEGVLGDSPATTFVCTIDSAVVGYTVVSAEPFPGGVLAGKSRRLRIHHLFVDDAARGIGLGELLLAAAAQWGRAQGADVCEMEVLPGHRAAKNFCEAHGLKARAITMSGSIGDVLDSMDLDEEETLSIANSVESALDRAAPAGSRCRAIAAGCVLVEDGRVLVAQRSEPPFEGYWSIPGGIPKAGETLVECALRELQEETGIDAKILGIAGVAERFWDSRTEGDAGFTIINFLGLPLRPTSSSEVEIRGRSDIVWAPPNSIPEPSVPGVAEFLAAVEPAVGAVANGEPLPAAVYSPPLTAAR